MIYIQSKEKGKEFVFTEKDTKTYNETLDLFCRIYEQITNHNNPCEECPAYKICCNEALSSNDLAESLKKIFKNFNNEKIYFKGECKDE